jgi:hypothetical protein
MEKRARREILAKPVISARIGLFFIFYFRQFPFNIIFSFLFAVMLNLFQHLLLKIKTDPEINSG